MAEYTVQSASQKKVLPDGKFGPMQVIALTLTGPEGTVSAEWFTKAETPLPAEGSTVSGEVSQGSYGLQFKKDKPQGFGAPRGRSPEDTRQIVRQHSQEMALRHVANMIAAGKENDGWMTVDPEGSVLRSIIDWFEQDAFAAKAETPDEATPKQITKCKQVMAGRKPSELAPAISKIIGLEITANRDAVLSAINGFTKGQASAFIDRMERTLPRSEEHPSDLDNSGFEPSEGPSLEDVLAEGDAGLERAA